MELDAAPGIDLAQVMENMRQQYEIMAEKNRQEAKTRFDKLVMLVIIFNTLQTTETLLRFCLCFFLQLICKTSH